MGTIQINFDSLKKEHWTAQETENARLLVSFVQQLMNDHDFDSVRKNFGNPDYRQHNRAIPDGMDALLEYVRAFTKRFPDYAYDVKHIHVDGDSVIFHSHVTINARHRGNEKKGLNIIDIWKIENGNIVEHWDSLQPMDAFMRFYNWMTGGAIRNNNGVY